MNQDKDFTQAWQEYERGKDYNRMLDYYNTVDKNEGFYAGEQWRGVKANGLATPVFNIFKRAINHFVAAILAQPAKITFIPELISEESESEEEKEINKFIDLINKYYEVLWEKQKMDNKTRSLLLDSALSGDMCLYSFWDSDIDLGQSKKGDIATEVIDGTNVYFGNPNSAETEKQPYIIIATRQRVSELKKEAKNNGINKADVDNILSDEDNLEQAGYRGKVELENGKSKDSGKATAILKLWKEDGKVFAEKSTKHIVIRKKWDTKLSKYPIAWNNWDRRKNSYHGQAVGTGIIPNQIYINKMFAMVMVFMQQMAFPKVVYDSTKITGVSNKIGAAIGVQGDTTSAIKSIAPPQISNQIILSIDKAIEYTKEMLGATDTFMGNVYPENTSAIMVTTKQAAVPLESIKQNLYQLFEDMGYQWLDFMANYYGKRKVNYLVNGKREVSEIDFSRLKNIKLNVKVEVGSGSYWNEIATMQVLDKLLQMDKIDFVEYLERVPMGMIPQKQKMIDSRQDETEETFKYLMLSQFLEANPELLQQVQGMPPEEQEATLMQMAIDMLGSSMGAMPQEQPQGQPMVSQDQAPQDPFQQF